MLRLVEVGARIEARLTVQKPGKTWVDGFLWNYLLLDMLND